MTTAIILKSYIMIGQAIANVTAFIAGFQRQMLKLKNVLTLPAAPAKAATLPA